ncbi:uncharacterized protein [Prorops nasuta]|uniref:uncharacterized protein n=1 Tax=Prorops nasuta TaxID=863751 RepID=UPI0034CFD6E7
MNRLLATPPGNRNLQEQHGSSAYDSANLMDQPVEDQRLPQATEHSPGILSRTTENQYSTGFEVHALWKQKLPAFMAEAPDIWFCIIEAEFAAGRITSDETKYLAVLRALDANTLKLLTDVLRSPPEKGKYGNLKNTILNRLSDSRSKQVDKLLRNLALGDRKPSMLLREMKELTKGEISEEILHQLWLERLPAHMRPHLFPSTNMSSEGIAEMADRLIEAFNTSYIMAASSSNGQQNSDKIEQKLMDMQTLILTCMQDIKDLKLQRQPSESRDVNRSSSRSRSRSRKESRSKDICYYHERFETTAGKPIRLSSLTTPDDGIHCSVVKEKRLHLHDKKSGFKYLIDSESDGSILSVSLVKNKVKKSALTFFAANSSPIATFGTKEMYIDLGLRRAFQWTFHIADIPMSIIGADFLSYYNLLIDLRNDRLIDSVTGLTSRGGDENAAPQRFHSMRDLNFAHRILTSGPPVTQRFRKLFGEKSAAGKAEIQLLLNNGILRPSSSPWSSPIHMVLKKDGTYRLCGDYRKLNSVTVPDMYPPPLMQDVFSTLHGKRIFSTIDLEKAYHHIPMHPDDIIKTAITTP